MYSEYLRRFGVEDEIVACLPAPPGRSLRLLLRRDSGGFTEQDKLLVELLRPHLHAVYQDAQRRQAGAPRLTARQWELLRLVAAGHSNADIARQPRQRPALWRGLCLPRWIAGGPSALLAAAPVPAVRKASTIAAMRAGSETRARCPPW
jgi:hypothetical protein